MTELAVPGLNQRVRRAIYDHVYSHDDHEVGGVLVGRMTDDSLPIVTGSIAALEADGQRASVTFTHDAWSSIHSTMDRDFPGEQIVGWYHSHPGFGIFLSTYDRFIHDNFFSDVRQIAYVVDPQAGTEGIFHWRDGKLVVLREGPADRPGTHRRTGRPRAAPPAAHRRLPPLLMALTAAVIVVLVLVLVLSGGGASTVHHAATKAHTTPPHQHATTGGKSK